RGPGDPRPPRGLRPPPAAPPPPPGPPASNTPSVPAPVSGAPPATVSGAPPATVRGAASATVRGAASATVRGAASATAPGSCAGATRAHGPVSGWPEGSSRSRSPSDAYPTPIWRCSSSPDRKATTAGISPGPAWRSSPPLWWIFAVRAEVPAPASDVWTSSRSSTTALCPSARTWLDAAGPRASPRSYAHAPGRAARRYGSGVRVCSARPTEDALTEGLPLAGPRPAPDSAMTTTLTATLRTNQGDIVLRLFPDHAPKTVSNFVELAQGSREWTDPRTGRPSKDKLYDGTIFHRVIPDFMIQGGDPLGTGTG